MTSVALLPGRSSKDLPEARCAVSADDPPASIPIDPWDTLVLVARAAETIDAAQRNAELVAARARDVLQVTSRERERLEGEILALQGLAAASEDKVAEIETRLREANLRAWNDRIQREEADRRECQALRRAEEAERRCQELEGLVMQIGERLRRNRPDEAGARPA